MFAVLTDSAGSILVAQMSDMDLYRQLGFRAAKRRDELHLTQAEVAKQIGLSRASLANLETGRQKILLHHVYRLVAALKLRSILDLVPNNMVEIEPVSFEGDAAVSDRQKVELEDFVRRARKRTQ